jgi:Flp pilus assembly protein TadG
MAMRAGSLHRRGGIMVLTLFSLTALLVLLGVELDACRLAAARQKDQVIADAAVFAAAQNLPNQGAARADAGRVLNQYRESYNRDFQADFTFYPPGAAVPTQVGVTVTERVPMAFAGLMGARTRPTKATAMASRVVPSSLLQGVVPLGVQYDQDFSLPSDGLASDKPVQLKLGSGDVRLSKGNYYALDFPMSSGSSDWRAWMKWGYASPLSVGQVIRSKTGNMAGPTAAALVSDIDSRLNRANIYPYSDDTYRSFHPGNPRVVVLPLVDWKSGSSGASLLDIKGFAAFWLDDYAVKDDQGKVSGRFVRYVKTTYGLSWDGVSIDPRIDPAYDGGFWKVTINE